MSLDGPPPRGLMGRFLGSWQLARTADLSIIQDQALRSQLGQWLGRSEELVENGPLLLSALDRAMDSAGSTGAPLRESGRTPP